MGRRVSLAQCIEHEASYQVNYHYEASLRCTQYSRTGRSADVVVSSMSWCGVSVVPARPVPAVASPTMHNDEISSKTRLKYAYVGGHW